MDFTVLHRRLAPTIKRIAWRAGGRDGHLNEQDLYQEALVHLWHECAAGSLDDKTDSYILQGCYFHIKNYLRKEWSRNASMSLDAPAGNDGATLSDRLHLEDAHAARFLDDLHTKMLAYAIRNNGLTVREKGIVECFADGLTTRQIGARFGVSHVAIIKSMAVIRKKCMKHVDPE